MNTLDDLLKIRMERDLAAARIIGSVEVMLEYDDIKGPQENVDRLRENLNQYNEFARQLRED